MKASWENPKHKRKEDGGGEKTGGHVQGEYTREETVRVRQITQS